jgi:ammonium transporter Rh
VASEVAAHPKKVDYTISPLEAEEHAAHEHNMAERSSFGITLALFQAFVIACYFVLTQHTGNPTEIAAADARFTGQVDRYYFAYSGVAFMIFIGFGFLMSFLRRYSFSAIGYNMLISAVAAEWGIICMAFFHHAAEDSNTHVTIMSIPWLIEGCFAAGAVMISFGAVLGKATPTQLIIIAFIEIIFYSLNFYFGYLNLHATDMGGSMFVHSFGAYFGIALSYAMTPEGMGAHKFNSSRTTSDMTAMFGTLVLWLYWPSFNGALAPVSSQFRVIINTVLALQGSCITAFIFSRLLSHEGKFDMVHIQNATLAGGVAIGTSADMIVGPGGAMLIGSIAGALSVFGYVKVTPWLETKGLYDTCGVHNLHGMPGVFAAITGAITAGVATSSVYGLPYDSIFGAGRSPSNQPGYQIGALVITLAVAIIGGYLTGLVVKFLEKKELVLPHGPKFPEGYFEDAGAWEVCEDYQQC